MIALLSFLLQAGHVFQPVDRSWTPIEDTLSLRPDAFVAVTPPKVPAWREKRYSQDRQERKILRYDPQGRLRMEADLLDGEQFTRLLRADGSLSAYHHHRNLRIVDGYSLSPDGKTASVVQDGIGELVTEGEDGARNHLQLLPGITVAKDFRGDRCVRISIWLGSDYYLRTPEGEELSLYAPAEHWSLQGQTVDLQRTDLVIEDGKVRRREAEPNPDVQGAAVWPGRRAAFMARVDEALNGAEQDWARLGLESIRDKSPWPK